jgi:tetratricopeptide (TPR) repeat protein
LAENYEGLPPEIEKLSERLAKDPKSLVFSSLANAYRKHNMVDEAIEILQKGLEIHPNYASARIVLGKCYMDKRMYELAKEQFKKALESDPQNVVVLENLGHVYKTLNQYNEAYDLFKRLLDLDPLNENFEREVEELKGLAKDISQESGQYDTFQTIPDQNVAGEQAEELPAAEPEPESDAPTLSDIFRGAPDTPEEASHQDSIAPETTEDIIEKPHIISTAADFSDMFESRESEDVAPLEPKPPVIEQPPEETQEEEKPVEQSIPLEEPTEEQPAAESTQQPPIIHGPPPADMAPQEELPQTSFEQIMEEPEHPPEAAIREETMPPQTESAPAAKEEEGTDFGAITSAFDNAGLETASKPSEKVMKDSLAPDTEAVLAELSDELSGEEEPASDISHETIPPTEEKPVLEAQQPLPPEAPKETAPVIEQPPAAEQQPRATETLAEIYLSQGFKDKALQIYRELLSKNPENESLKQKVASLEQQVSAESSPPPQPPQESSEKEPSDQERRTQSKNLDSFQDWLKKFQK